MVDDVPVLADNPRATVLVLVSLYLGELEIIIDLPIGFPINNIISLLVNPARGILFAHCAFDVALSPPRFPAH